MCGCVITCVRACEQAGEKRHMGVLVGGSAGAVCQAALACQRQTRAAQR